MRPPIRLLLADDSAVVRRLLSETLTAEGDMCVVAEAGNGQCAVDLTIQLRPDVVILDVEMPVLNGFAALREIRKSEPCLPVVMFSSATVEGGEAAYSALQLGASDYLAKPSGTGHVTAAIAYVKRELAPRIRAVCGKKFRIVESTAEPVGAAATDETPCSPTDIVAIGSSTGGPGALAEILHGLPPRLNVPIVVAQHMPTIFTRLLAERLDRQCALQVREGIDGSIVQPGEVWIAPGDRQMEIRYSTGLPRLHIHDDLPANSCRPSVDVLFRSAAKSFGEKTMAVVLTGMGRDGVEGCRAVRAAGGQVIVQDEHSCVVWGMPGAVVEAGLADRVRPLNELATEIAMNVDLADCEATGV